MKSGYLLFKNIVLTQRSLTLGSIINFSKIMNDRPTRESDQSNQGIIAHFDKFGFFLLANNPIQMLGK